MRSHEGLAFRSDIPSSGRAASDWESLEESVSFALARLEAVLEDHSPLRVASALAATARAVHEVRRYDSSIESDRARRDELVELMQRMATLLHALSHART